MGTISLVGMEQTWRVSVLVLITTATLVSSQTRTCLIYGTQRVRTLAGEVLDISNQPCAYTASRVCTKGSVLETFDVRVKNERIWDHPDSVVRALYVEVQLGTGSSAVTVRMYANGNIEVDGAAASMYVGSGITTARDANGWAFTRQVPLLTSRLVVTINENGMVAITIPDEYIGQLCGLCDPSTENVGDSTSQRGFDLSAEHKILDTSCELPALPFDANTCREISQPDNVAAACSALQNTNTGASFEGCINKNPTAAAEFYTACLNDYCEALVQPVAGTIAHVDLGSGCMADGSCAENSTAALEGSCHVAEALAVFCRTILEVPPSDNWRDEEMTCPKACPSGSTYATSVTTCDSCVTSGACPLSSGTEDGCTCPTGEKWSGNTCVSENSCGCVHNEAYHQSGEQWLSSTCSQSFTCSLGTLAEAPIACDTVASCVTTSTGVQACECPTDPIADGSYSGDGITCTLTCRMGYKVAENGISCEQCSIGEYQDVPNTNQSCIKCPDPEQPVTTAFASTALTDCIAINLLADSVSSNCPAALTDHHEEITVNSDLLPRGILFGYNYHRFLYVSTNGIISFTDRIVGRFPTELEDYRYSVIAPLWFKQDMRDIVDASMCISVYETPLDMDASETSQESVTQLSTIRAVLTSSGTGGVNSVPAGFSPIWALVVSWKNSHPNPSIWFPDESATYQAIITTDGSLTYAMFSYDPSTTLDKTNQHRPIYMGYNAQSGLNGTFKFNYYLSDTPGLGDIANDPSNTNTVGRWIFKIADTGLPSVEERRCINWLTQQDTKSPLGPVYNCPCNLLQLKKTFYYHLLSDNCAVSYSQVERDNELFYMKCCYTTDGLLDDQDRLNTGVLSGGMAVYHHQADPSQIAQYLLIDEQPFSDCCQSSDYCNLYRVVRPVSTCEEYVPPTGAAGYGDPHIQTVDGDSYTFNPIGEYILVSSENFNMHARFAQAFDESGNKIKATITEAVAARGNFTDTFHVELDGSRTSILIYINGVDLSTELESPGVVKAFQGFTFRRLDQETVIAAFTAGFTMRITVAEGVLSMTHLVERRLVNTNITGLLGNFNGNSSDDRINRMGVDLCPMTCTENETFYLYRDEWRIRPSDPQLFHYHGNFDTASHSDVTFIPQFLEDLINSNATLASFCQENSECIYDVMLTNNTALGTQTLTVVDGLKDLDSLQSASPFVENGSSALDVTIGETVTVTYTVSDSDTAPQFLFLEAQPGDIPPNATLERVEEIEGGQPGSSAPAGGGTVIYLFTWTPPDETRRTLRLYALDNETYGLSQVYTQNVRLCRSCENGGVCDHSGTAIAQTGVLDDAFLLFGCNCTTGYEGDRCASDFDGCEDHDCDRADCIDINATAQLEGGPTYKCGPCPAGFQNLANETNSCTDIIECNSVSFGAPNPCDIHSCINTAGSYKCECNAGYKQVNMTECTDSDECFNGQADCPQGCTNTPGDFNCFCFGGYIYDKANKTCLPDNDLVPCDLRGLNCSSSLCDNSTGSWKCQCPYGTVFQNDALADNGSQCIDFDECSTNPCEGPADVVNCTQKSGPGFTCSCSIGYMLTDSDLTCSECPTGKYGVDCLLTCNCKDRAGRCDNKIGCTECFRGYSGEQCLTDADECAEAVPVCSSYSNCVNLDGGFKCDCHSGYVATSATTCENLNECASLSPPCHASASCNDTEGGFLCTCHPGFTGDGISCIDINECDRPNVCYNQSGVVASCMNTVGSFICTCPSGYSGPALPDSANGCVDDNECDDVASPCGQGENERCVNQPGSFECTCDVGYRLSPTGCVNINECLDDTKHDCRGNLTCTDKDPPMFFSCTCPGGNYLVSATDGCLDVDECIIPSQCSQKAHSTCENTVGAFECVCDAGWVGSTDVNTTCEDENECTRISTPAVCDSKANSTCKNTDGSYECNCDLGFQEDNGKCFNFDECANGTDCFSNGKCIDTIGSFTCGCQPGFDLWLAGDGCSDINECFTGASCVGTLAQCVNTVGSFQCLCPIGYNLHSTDCIRNDTLLFFMATQTFGLSYQAAWEDNSTEEYRQVYNNIRTSLDAVFASVPEYVGVNPSTFRLYSDGDTGTVVVYEAVFTNESESLNFNDVVAEASNALQAGSFQLPFGNTTVEHIAGLTFFDPLTGTAIPVTCDTFGSCGSGRCEVGERDTLSCVCDEGYTGLRCETNVGGSSDPAELLPIWISVAVALALLVAGLCACVTIFAVRRQRNRRRGPPIHRSTKRRGPALYNPSARMPAEAYNYQFPIGSQASQASDDTSSSGGSTISSAHSHTSLKNIHRNAPFAPKWPGAVFSTGTSRDGPGPSSSRSAYDLLNR